jgi:hypothetical protein
LLRAGCNGIGHADGTGEALLASAVAFGGMLSLSVAGVFGALARRAHEATARAYRIRLLALALGLVPFVVYAWVRLSH